MLSFFLKLLYRCIVLNAENIVCKELETHFLYIFQVHNIGKNVWKHTQDNLSVTLVSNKSESQLLPVNKND